MSTVTPVVLEIGPAGFEDELRSGADVVVLDTRDRDSFAAWRVSGAAVLHNVPEDELAEDPEGLVARIPADARVRVICHAGIGSRRVVAALAGRFAEVASVSGGMIGWSRVLQAAEVAVEGPFDVVQFRREARGCLSYLVIAGDEALVVDPAPDITTYRDEAARRGAVITRIFDTHVHADHVSGARELAAATGALLHLSRAALRRGLRYGSEVASVVDGNRLRLGEESVKVIALPGHTSDMTGLLVGDAALIGGDSLFVDSVARPDLEAGSEHAEDAARELFATLAERIAALPDRTLLLPCHYPGGRLTQPLVASLAEVRERVGELGLGREAFVARVLAQLPPVPTNHLAIIAVNLGEPMAADDIARLEVGVNKCAAKQEWDT
jgi:glyoxylase-like metal-dependent hydrolase (beta-lactamase superfamily II)